MGKLKYLIQRLRNMNYRRMWETVRRLRGRTRKWAPLLFLDILWCGFRYSAGYVDYEIFEFYRLPAAKRATFITRGINDRLVRLQNTRDSYRYFEDKVLFNRTFPAFLGREWIDLRDCDDGAFARFLAGKDAVIVKPVDGNSSAGVVVCHNGAEVREACVAARQKSASGRVVVERYIENGGELFTVRYLLRDGEATLYLTMDDYIVDPVEKKSLISGYIVAPGKYTEYYLSHMDKSVRRLLAGLGLKNGTAFIQALPYQGKIYLMEMGFRLSGGMMYKVTQPLMGVNDMKMMLRLALGGPMYTDEEVKNIDFSTHRCAGQLTVPLSAGTIGRIEGLEQCAAEPGVTDTLQYYRKGETIKESVLGTYAQLLCRFTLVADSLEEMTALADRIQKRLRVYDTEGNRMNLMQTDFSRLQKRN